jgi:hypothetical protein
MKPLRFRPHNFLCTVGFQGFGYSPAFVDNLQQVSDQLNSDDSVIIEVVDEADTICQPCPHRRGKGCATQAKIDRLDQAHATALGLKIGDRITWGEAKQRIREKITLATHLEICHGCEWLDHQMCRKALEKLRS